MKLAYLKTSHNSWQEWIFEVDTDFNSLESFPPRAERNNLDIDDYMKAQGYKQLNIDYTSIQNNPVLCSRELGNEWTSHYIVIFK
jgi:hypothetical protein